MRHKRTDLFCNLLVYYFLTDVVVVLNVTAFSNKNQMCMPPTITSGEPVLSKRSLLVAGKQLAGS